MLIGGICGFNLHPLHPIVSLSIVVSHYLDPSSLSDVSILVSHISPFILYLYFSVFVV
jgi:hypothetical protein